LTVWTRNSREIELFEMKKSSATVIPFRNIPPEPPKALRKAGNALWISIQELYRIDDPGGLSHLLTACRSEDDIARMRATVEKDGDTMEDRFKQKREHPLLAAIRGAEGVKRAALKSLNLDIEPLRDRPGRPGGR
jgi:hypothetical protein